MSAVGWAERSEAQHASIGLVDTKGAMQASMLGFASSAQPTVLGVSDVSTDRMDQDDMAVVDERLRIRGLQSLRVADASVMPTVVSGNTNPTCVMIGEKAADMLFRDTR